MNVSCTTVFSHDLKPFEAPFLLADDHQFLLKDWFLKDFED